MQKFYEIYPEYKSVVIPEDKFSWGWYYAAQLMGDIESAKSTESYTQKLQNAMIGRTKPRYFCRRSTLNYLLIA
ncbi:MAG: hypothetical protein HC846_09655 [Blastocatellia bacterium]|nr:hypothetical protein [Blastocatellia bacterium]